MGGPAQPASPAQPDQGAYQGPPGQYDADQTDQNQAQAPVQPQPQPQAQAQNDDDEDAVAQEHELATGGSHLGVVIEGMTNELRQFFGAPTDRGVLIAHVEHGSVAEQAGIHVGDVLLRVGHHRIASADDVKSALSESQTATNKPIKLDVLRQGQRVRLQAMLEPSQQQQNAPQNPML
jgi:C-terminal processing protease CtpA/Prc